MPGDEQTAEQLQAQNDALLPRWQSHKEVRGDKIMEEFRFGALLLWRLAGGAEVVVAGALSCRVPPGTSAIGGYYVLYADGYESWSPAKAFEDGYTRI